MELLKNLICFALLATLLSTLPAARSFDPYTPGAHSLVRVRLNASVYPGLPVHLSAWAPVETGTYPVVYFFSGFQATTPVEVYSDVLERITTHGLVVVAPWNLTTNFYPEDKVDEIQGILDWTSEHLDEVLIEAGADLTTDYSTAFAMTHSSGAHLVCSYLQLVGCGPFKGQALTSPVDGVDPYGQVQDFCTAVGETLNFSLPTVVMAAGLDPVPGREGLNISCAPDNLSNRRFYNAQDPGSPRWYLNATDFGHMDYTDYVAENFNELIDFCASNEEASAIDLRNYKNYIAGTSVSFFLSLLDETYETDATCATYLTYLQDTAVMPVSVLGEYVDPSGGACPPGFCAPVAP